MTNAHRNDWAASLDAVATSTSYDDYISKMAKAVALQHWPTTVRVYEAWGHNPDLGYHWFHAEDAAGTWLGNVEWLNGQPTWVVTQGYELGGER